MKRSVFCIFIFLMGGLLFFFSSAFAGNEGTFSMGVSDWRSILSLAVKPRVSVALSLERYEIWIDRMPGPDPQETPSLKATLSMRNQSGADIPFELISHCGEDKPVQFLLRDAEDNVLWQHIWIDPLLKCPDYAEYWTFANKGKFLYQVDVPLLVGGEFLKPGEYLLEAFIDGTPRYGAYAPFRVDHAY